MSADDGVPDRGTPIDAGVTLTQSTVGSASWTAIGQVVRQGLQVVTGVVLARLLVPADFGVYAMVSAFSGFAVVLSDLGLSGAVVQRQDLRPAHLDVAFWTSATLGVVLAGALVIGAPTLGSFYDDQRVVGVARVVAAVLIFTTLAAVPRAMLLREMRLRALVVVEMGAAIVAAVVAVTAAAMGARYWAIPIQSLVVAIITTGVLWVRNRWRPRFRIEGRAWRELMSYGSYQAGFSSLNYWSRNADNLLIGRFVGPTDLGLYTRAYNLMLSPILQVASVVGQVMFPAMSRIGDDLARARRGYLAAIRLIAFVTTPMLLGAAAAAPALIEAVLGDQWVDAVPLFQVLAIAGAMQAVGTSVGWVYQSQGRTDLLFRWGLFSTAVTIATFVVGIRWGAMGVALAYTARTPFLLAISFWHSGRLIELPGRRVLREVAPTVVGALAMAVVVLAVGALAGDLGAGGVGALQVGAGVLAFGLHSHWAEAQAVADLKRVIATLRDRRSPARVSP